MIIESVTFDYTISMPYLYETHLHTSQVSSCAVTRGRDYIQRYLDLGYTGIIVTDHFYNGNCSLKRNLPWEKWVHAFCRGYEDAREEGERLGLDVFFGWEESFQGGDDYLVYGLDKQWLLEHPEVRFWTREKQFEVVGQNGGCVVHAHPFRQQYYIRNIRFSVGLVDAVEVANSAHNRSFDVQALAYAKKHRLPATSGSDIHIEEDVYGNNAMGVYLDKKIESIYDYVDAVKSNSIRGLKVPSGRFNL